MVNQSGAEKKIPFDSLVFSGRMIPENDLSRYLKNMTTVFIVGDCVAPERIMEAVWATFKMAREIEL